MRTLRNSLLLAAGSLLLAACGGKEPVDEDAEAAGDLPPPPSVETSDPSGAAPPPNASPQPRPGNAASNSAATIPASFRGRWGLGPADCNPASGAAKGMLVVGDRELRFFESVAVPIGNVESSGDHFSADFAFTGEGMNWTKFQSLQLQNGKLVRTESTPMASYTYARCG